MADIEDLIKRQQERFKKRPEPKRDDPDLRFVEDLQAAHAVDEKKKGYKCQVCKAFNSTSFQKGERITLGNKYPMIVFYRTCLSCGYTFVPRFCLNVLNKALRQLTAEGLL